MLRAHNLNNKDWNNSLELEEGALEDLQIKESISLNICWKIEKDIFQETDKIL